MSEIEATLSPHLLPSEEIRQNIIEWTPEKLARYKSKPQSYWSFRRYVYALNWLKPASKKRYITRAKEFGHLLTSVDLQDTDFREDITLDWCYVATQWATGGKTYLQHSRAGVFTEYLAHIPQVQAQLESSQCPGIIKRWYKEDLQQYFAGEEYTNSLWNSKGLESTTTPKLDLCHTPYPFESPPKENEPMNIEDVAAAIFSKLEPVQDVTDFQRVAIECEYVRLEKYVTKRSRFKGRDLALLQAKTALYFCYVFADIHKESPDEAVGGFRRHLEMVRLCMREYLGLAPLQAEARQREDCTQRWVSLYRHPAATPEDRKGIVKKARSRYADFDVSLFTEEVPPRPTTE